MDAIKQIRCRKCEREVLAGVMHYCAGSPQPDPLGENAHTPGVKLDTGKRRAGLVINGFARALLAVSDVATYGAEKYTDGGWVFVQDGQTRYTDAMYRHLLAEASGELCDEESELLHAAHAAWNALARLDLMLREGEASMKQASKAPKVAVGMKTTDGHGESLSTRLPRSVKNRPFK